MFTGIVEQTGIVQSIQPSSGGISFQLRAVLRGRALKIGDSLAVNGCCLTVEKIHSRARDKVLQFTILDETWRRTNFQFTKPGAKVNLEQPLRVGRPLGGHFVSGHIDGLGIIKRWEQFGKDYVLEVGAAERMMRHMIFKGSIAVDGISLTLAAVRKKSFEAWIIPHTRAVTVLGERHVGDAVNLETDMLAKFVERLIAGRFTGRDSSSGNAA